MGQYRPMFNIAMEHTYFSSGMLSGVELVPTTETAKLMTNANLVLRKRADGVTVFFDNDYLDTLRLYAQDQDSPLKINFECDVEHHNFQNFTAAVFGENKTFFFDSSQNDQPIGKKYLHSTDFVSDLELAENFTSPHALNERHSSVLQFSENRALLFGSEQTRKYPTGKTELDRSDTNRNIEITRDFVRVSNPGKRNQPSLGLVSILVTAQELEQLIDSSSQIYNEYHIRFKARETHWKYFLVGDANREGVFLMDVNGEIEFDYLGEETLADGRHAKVFLSKQAIPMRDRAKHKIQLLVPRNNRTKVLVKRLAVASAKRINKVSVEDQELFVSEIYVNF